MKDLTIKDLTIKETENLLTKLGESKPLRMTKKLDNGNIAILQIADPEDVPTTAKILRAIPGKLGKFLASIEAALRVGMIVYNNSMREKRPRQGKSRKDRK